MHTIRPALSILALARSTAFALSLAGGVPSLTSAQDQSVQSPAAPSAAVPSWTVYEKSLLDVKFREGTQVRVRNARPVDVTSALGRSSAADATAAATASALNEIVRAIPGGDWRRVHSVSETNLSQMRARGIARSGRSLPDLNLYQRLTLPAGLDAYTAKRILLRAGIVEGAYYVPRPPPPPAAPDYSIATSPVYQKYLDAAPIGIDARYSASLGWLGQGISICDVEYDFNQNHVDLPPITRLGEIEIDPFFDQQHGTAVFGVMVGLANGSGVTGIAPSAGPNFFSPSNTVRGNNVARALVECIAALEPGDVILIEQQTQGPNFTGSPPHSQSGLVPTEWNKPVYDAIRTAVANDIVVVETAGNGSQNLDNAEYSTGHDGHWPFLLENDSGAIIVTQGRSSVPHGALATTNYGATVDLHAWGESIVTTGYGNLYDLEGVNAQFTKSFFGGSSGAGAIVAGAAAALQSGYKALTGTVLPAAQLRSIFRSTGTPGSGLIAGSPLPNLFGAISIFSNTIYVDASALGANDGTSWNDALTTLSSALASADAGTVIMVAQGEYFPTAVGGPRTATFQLNNGVALLGGFPAGGGVRDPKAHPTYLSGNIDADSALNSAGDSYHVVTGSGTDPTAILDGFVVIGGHANGPAPHDAGAGVLIRNGSPTIRATLVRMNMATIGAGAYVADGNASFVDVTFDNNTASAFGGGLYNSASSVMLNRVTFTGNRASGASAEGGGLFSTGGGAASTTPLAFDVRFYDNFAFRGGALANWPGSELRVDNAIFSGNSAADIGGAVLNDLSEGGSLRINNATFANNHANSGAAMFAFNRTTISNSIVWGNSAPQLDGTGPINVWDSVVEGGFPGFNVTAADPLFRDDDGPDRRAGTLDDDLRLQGGSPAIDSAASDCVAVDIAGHNRIGTCDRGAHEYLGNAGTFWSNGEVDSLSARQSSDQSPTFGPIRQSADDFLIPAAQACDISSVRVVVADPTANIEATMELYTDAGGVPGSLLLSRQVGSSPGTSLGSILDGRMWQYQFDIVPPQRLSGGTFWVSVFGKQESLATGVTGVVSAGNGSIRGNPHQFRERGFPWVDGGVFHGGASHDLALDIDARCGCASDSYCNDGDPDTNDRCDNLECRNVVPPPPANDDWLNARSVSAGFTPGTLLGASNDGSGSVGTRGAKDAWYSYTAASDLVVEFNTCGTHDATTLNTVLSIHSGGSDAERELDANDDWISSDTDRGACEGIETIEPFRDSSIKRTVLAGETVYVRVAQFASDTNGDFVLNVIERTALPQAGAHLYAPTSELAAGTESCFDLLSYLGGPLEVESVAELAAATQQTWQCSYDNGVATGEDFSLALGAAYLVKLTDRGALSSGIPPACPPVTLEPGPNLVGIVKPASAMSCFDVIDAFAPGVIATVERLAQPQGRFEFCAAADGPTPVGHDFPLKAGEGYVLHATRASRRVNLNATEHPVCD